MIRMLLAASLLSGATAVTAEPLKFYNGRLFIPARVNEVATEALLDSGAEATIVDPAFAAKARFPEGSPQELDLRIIGKRAGEGIGGATQRDSVRLDRLEVAGRTFRNVIAGIDDQPGHNDMNVGTSILKNFLITADLKDRTVWLEPLAK